MKRVLAINAGSSSLKFALYAMMKGEERNVLSGSVSGIGLATGVFSASGPKGLAPCREEAAFAGHDAAFRRILAWIEAQSVGPLSAIGHRIVHGGAGHAVPELVSSALIEALRRLVPYVPEHLPQALSLVRMAVAAYPSLPQVACFDTAFHRSMPSVAKRYPLPELYRLLGLERYGFHGISCSYLVNELERTMPGVTKGRLILAHLGHGASMTAVRGGRSVDTTMGFSPAGGLVMSSRSGDLDPGAVLFLLDQCEGDSARLAALLNHQSGLLGVSGRTGDMAALLEAEASGDRAAAEAVELFCYQAIRHAGSLAAVLGGLEGIVFAGGIGEQAPEIRRRICDGLGFLGVGIDQECNRRNGSVISSENSSVLVRVMRTDEERMIARETFRLVEGLGAGMGEAENQETNY